MIQREEKIYFNRSLERALDILTSFDADKAELTLAQLTATVNLSRATVLRLCSTLESFSFLKRDPETKRYSLGIRLFELGSMASSTFSLRTAASSHLSRLGQKVGATVYLGILDNDDLVYIDKKDNPANSVGFPSEIGHRHPPYWGMVGPTIMAYRSDSDIERIMRARRLASTAKNSFSDKEEFVAWLRRIRKQGYAVDRERTIDGIGGVGAPIRDASATVIAAVGIALISSSLDPRDVKVLADEAVRTANAVSRDLGYMGNKESHST